MNVSAGIPSGNMAVNQRASVTGHAMVMGQKHVEQVGEIVSIGQVCIVHIYLSSMTFQRFC